MASGMEMLLKTMGLDPSTMMKQVEDFGKVIAVFKEQLDRVEASQKRIETLLTEAKETNG